MGDGAVVVAVILVWMMQMALHQIVRVITVRDCLVTASRAVGMLRVMVTAGVGGRTGGRIRAAVGERMLVHVPTVDAVQMVVVEIIDVVVVLDGRMHIRSRGYADADRASSDRSFTLLLTR
jgi:hypothetical protein